MEHSPAKLTLIIGAMYTGKTTELIRILRRFKYANKRTNLVKWKDDVRYSNDQVMTHDKCSESALSVNRLNEIDLDTLNNTDVIGIDEGQFFSDLGETVEKWLDTYPNLIILISALSGDFLRRPFGDVWKLAPRASDIKFMTGVCHYCGYDGAAYSLRLTNEQDIVLLGGKTSYVCTCETCYKKHSV